MDIKNIIFFLSGVALGSVATYFIVKDKYEEQMNDETEQIKTYYENKYKVEEEEKPEELNEEFVKSNLENLRKEDDEEPDYQGIIQGLNYNQFSTKVGDKPAKRPYQISMDDYNTDTKYIKKVVSFFEDDEVCMDNDTKEVMDNVTKDIGMDNLELINIDGTGEIYIRNDQLGIDYNIVSEPGSYEDFLEVGFDE